MADCAHQGQGGASTPCRTCGGALCDACRRQVRGVVYCEDCLAARVAGEPAPRPTEAAAHQSLRLTAPDAPSPMLAALAGVLPGVGACYNGQYQKGVLHALMFPMLIGMAHSEDIFGFLFPVYFGYLVYDAYQTALARREGRPLPDYLGLRGLFGSSEKPISAAFASEPIGSVDAPNGEDAERPPLGAVVLIVLGVVLLFSNLGWFPRRPVGTYWPIALIVIGIQQGRRRLRTHQ
jgi:hypothetical protein